MNGKKDGLQKYNVRINYTDNYGKAKQMTRIAYGSEEAKSLEKKLSDEVKAKGECSIKKMTVHQLFDEYISVKQYEVREMSIYKDKQNYRLYVQPAVSNVRIDKLTIPLLQEWKLSVEQKGLALKTRTHAYAIFRAILNYAVKMEYLPRNPLLIVGNFKDPMQEKSRVDYYTAQQFKQFIAIAKQLAEERQIKHNDLSEWDFYVFFNIAFYTGLRKSEIYALKWNDIDNTHLSVKRSISQKLKGDDRETPPKNRSSARTLQMPLPLIKILNEHKKRQEEMENFTEDYRICGGERTIRDTMVQNKNKLYANISGLKVIRIHDYRHSHVSVLANEGINIQEIARRLGHSKVEVTWNTYSHLYPREEEKAVDVLNRIA